MEAAQAMREGKCRIVCSSKVARRKSSTPRNIGDALLKMANNNSLAALALLANLAD